MSSYRFLLSCTVLSYFVVSCNVLPDGAILYIHSILVKKAFSRCRNVASLCSPRLDCFATQGNGVVPCVQGRLQRAKRTNTSSGVHGLHNFFCNKMFVPTKTAEQFSEKYVPVPETNPQTACLSYLCHSNHSWRIENSESVGVVCQA